MISPRLLALGSLWKNTGSELVPKSEARFHDEKGPKTADKIVSPSSTTSLSIPLTGNFLRLHSHFGPQNLSAVLQPLKATSQTDAKSENCKVKLEAATSSRTNPQTSCRLRHEDEAEPQCECASLQARYASRKSLSEVERITRQTRGNVSHFSHSGEHPPGTQSVG